MASLQGGVFATLFLGGMFVSLLVGLARILDAREHPDMDPHLAGTSADLGCYVVPCMKTVLAPADIQIGSKRNPQSAQGPPKVSKRVVKGSKGGPIKYFLS